VRVAVVDSGIDAGHPDLEGSVDGGGVSVGLDDAGEAVLTPGPHEDAFGHGTACAGIIHRLAPRASITSVKVLGPGLAGKASAFLAGLGWAVEQGFDVINLSLGTTRRDWALAFYEVCDRAYFRGSFVVTAANNLARSSFPSLYASVASVACNLSKDPFRFHYNPEPPTEFLAPGIDVEVSWRGGARIVGTGNSYAAPHIAGIAALIKSKHPELRPFQLKTVLWATAANVREAPRPAGRLTGALRARSTSLGQRATTALRAVQA
jgi:subtilisin family serine protease